MRYCFIVAISRLDYYNFDLVIPDLKEDTRFVLITDFSYFPNISKKTASFFYSIHPFNEITIDACSEVISKINEIILQNSVIVCSNEKLLMLCAKLREKYCMNGAKPYQYAVFESKRNTKQCLSLSGIKVTESFDFNGIDTSENLEEYHQFIFKLHNGKYVIKPLNGGGSEDTAIIKCYNDLFHWYQVSFKVNEQYITEKFVDAELYHCDSFILNGEIKFAVASKYLFPNLYFTYGKPIISYPEVDNVLVEKILKFNAKIITALNTPNGAAHLEFFVKNEELIFLEIGPRSPGKSVVKCHELNYGINLYELTLRCELGIKSNFSVKPNMFHAIVCVPVKPGKVLALMNPQIKSNYEIEWLIKPGDVIRSLPTSLKDGVAANLMLFNQNYYELINDLLYFKKNSIYTISPIE